METQEITEEPRRPSRRRPALAAARLTDGELESLRQHAERDGKSVSQFVRELVLTAVAS